MRIVELAGICTVGMYRWGVIIAVIGQICSWNDNFVWIFSEMTVVENY